MKVAILGAAHQHVAGIAREMVRRPDVDLVGIWEPDAELRSRYLGGLSAPVAPSVQAPWSAASMNPGPPVLQQH
jgi:hypothetical protein